MSNDLDVALMKDPYGDWSPENGDRHTDIAFAWEEWSSFYFGTLKAAHATEIEGEPLGEYFNRDRVAFEDSLKDFPLLARSYEFYMDAHFAADEISRLKDELDRASKLDVDKDARVLLDGMLEACKLAVESQLGIILICS